MPLPGLGNIASLREFIFKWWKHHLKILGQMKQPISNHKIVGLDIGSDMIKLLQISPTAPHTIQYFNMTPLPHNSVVKGEIKDPGAVSNAIQKMFSKSGIETKNVAIAIPRLSTIIKNFTVSDQLNLDEIESRTQLEAARYFPDLIGEIFLDFAVLGPSEKDPHQLEIMLVACRKDQIKPYLEVLYQAGLNPKIVDVDCYVLERALTIITKDTPLETVGMLNIDANLITLIVLHNNNLIYVREQNYDGRELQNQIKNLDNQANASYTSMTGEALTAEQRHDEILQEGLSTYLRHTMQFFYSSKQNMNIQRIFLAGEMADIANLDKFIQKETGVEVILANPFTNMLAAPKVNKEIIEKYSPVLMLCCGLALSKLTG